MPTTYAEPDLETYAAMTFDARAAKALQPGQHLISPDYPGLRLEAFTDRTTWTYRYKSPVDGRMRQTKIGTWPAMSIHAAVVAWEGLRAAREGGSDLAAEAKQAKRQARAEAEALREQAKREAYTVADVARDYLEGYIERNRAPKGAAEVRRMFAKMLGELGKRPAVSLTRADAFDLIQTISGKAPVQAKRLRADLGAAWDYAYDSGRLKDDCPNWWRQILHGKIKSKGKIVQGERVGTSKRVLTPEEVGRLINWLPHFSSRMEDALVLYLWTGVRGAEIVSMEGKEVVAEGDQLWWIIPKAKTKNARHAGAGDLRVPLFGRAREVVSRRKACHGDGWLFPMKQANGRVTHALQKTITETVWRYQPYCTLKSEENRPRLTVTHWAPHDLRRTARTMLASLGCPHEVGESILGHMVPGVAGIYNLHAYDAERAEWLKKLSDRLEALAESAIEHQ